MTKLKKINWLRRAHSMGLSYYTITIIVVLSLAATITEIFGIGIFLPIFQFIRFDGDVSALALDSNLWQYIITWFSFLNIEPSLIILLLISFGFFLSRQVFTYLRLIYNTAVRQYITQIQRNRVFNGYLDADTAYHDNIPVGNLVSVITTEVNNAVMGIMAPIELIAYLIMLSGYLFILSLLSWQMTLLSVVVVLIASRVPNIWIKKSVHTGRKLVVANTSMSEFLVGRLRSPRLVRLAGTEAAEKNEFYQLTQAQRKHTVFSSILQARTEVSMEPIVIGLSFIFLYFSYTMLQLQIEVIGLYLVVALRLLPIVKGVISQWQTVQRFLGSIEAIESRLNVMQDCIEKDTGVKSLGKINQSILMRGVSYHYPDCGDYALHNVKIEFEANKITALVGPSGSGKSTLIDLLLRLRIPTKGFIQVDNVDIQKYTLKSLRRIVSYVPQSPQIFDGTVKDHILYGKMNATDEDVLEAAKMAGAEDFISKLPQGFDSILGEDAVKLSGGQRQRLDLARALVKKSPVLILDEPTSNLDVESEEAFKRVLDKINKQTNTTIIIVTHRLASITNADKIIVLNRGEIDGSGTHLKLLSQGGWYVKAWNTQSSK